jgi:hypothetical protein
MDLTIGVNSANLETTQGAAFTQGLGSVLGLQVGGSVTRKEKWGAAVQGGLLLDSYTYNGGDTRYTVSLLSPRVEGRAYYMIPLSRELQTHLQFGFGYGWMFFGSDELTSTEGSLTAVSRSPDLTSRFLFPEAGISKRFGRHRIAMTLRYQHALEQTMPSITTALSTPNSMGMSTAIGNYLALNVRFELGFWKKDLPTLPPADPTILERSDDAVASFNTGREHIHMLLWDNAETDGDTISIVLNGNTILYKHGLSAKKKKVRLHLQKGQNSVRVVANSEGRIPPNTASCVLRGLRGTKRLLLSTSEQENDLITITRAD